MSATYLAVLNSASSWLVHDSGSASTILLKLVDINSTLLTSAWFMRRSMSCGSVGLPSTLCLWLLLFDLTGDGSVLRTLHTIHVHSCYLAKTNAAPAAPATKPTVHKTLPHHMSLSSSFSLKYSLKASYINEKKKIRFSIHVSFDYSKKSFTG